MDEQLRVLRTAHFSVNEFLEHHFGMSEAHNQAAEICLTLMRRPNIYNQLPIPRFINTTSGGLLESTPRPKIYEERHPLRYYMFDYWAYHLRFSGDARNSLLELQKEFFNASPAYYAWLQEAEKRWHQFKPMSPETKLTPLWVASYYQLSDICKSLLRSNVDNCNVRNKARETPLFTAARLGYEEIVKLLLEKEGVDLNSKNSYGGSPLYISAFKGHKKVVKLLLEKDGVDLNSQIHHSRETPLWTAATEGHEAIVKLFLDKEGVDINPEDKDGHTPLLVAASYGKVAVVKLFLEREGGTLIPKTMTARHHYVPLRSGEKRQL
ncbi:hypothetical protein RUND412_002486 [Rhizina undulata]